MVGPPICSGATAFLLAQGGVWRAQRGLALVYFDARRHLHSRLQRKVGIFRLNHDVNRRALLRRRRPSHLYHPAGERPVGRSRARQRRLGAGRDGEGSVAAGLRSEANGRRVADHEERRSGGDALPGRRLSLDDKAVDRRDNLGAGARGLGFCQRVAPFGDGDFGALDLRLRARQGASRRLDRLAAGGATSRRRLSFIDDRLRPVARAFTRRANSASAAASVLFSRASASSKGRGSSVAHVSPFFTMRAEFAAQRLHDARDRGCDQRARDGSDEAAHGDYARA